MNYDDLLEKARKATREWFTAGRPDMQSYTGDGVPFKNLYNDKLSKLEAARVYGDNSIPDSQYIAACSPERIIELVERYKEAVEVLSWIEMDTRDHTAPNRRSNDKARAFLEKVK